MSIYSLNLNSFQQDFSNPSLYQHKINTRDASKNGSIF